LFRKKDVIIYFRCLVGSLSYILLFNKLKKFFRIKFIYELHTFNNDFYHRFILSKQDKIICISDNLRNILCNSINYDIDKTIIARHSIDISDYTDFDKKITVRNSLNLPVNKNIITYTGKIYKGYKEIVYILESAKLLTDCFFILVGGTDEAVRVFKDYCNNNKLNNVFFTGFLSHQMTVKYQLASDILLMYYPNDLSTKDFTSPGKMIEYMASGRGIISVNFKVLTEVLKNEVNSLLIESDNPVLLTEAVKRLLNDTELYDKISINARNSSLNYTWDNRAEIITNFILAS
jgi:glycosyltransferase involved in cell wall biosynthesis